MRPASFFLNQACSISPRIRDGPIFSTGFSILSGTGFMWIGGWVGKNLSKRIVDFGMGEWGPRHPFAEMIEKPVPNIGPPLSIICSKHWIIGAIINYHQRVLISALGVLVPNSH